MAIVTLTLSVTIYKIFLVEIVQDHDLDLWNGSRSNTNILIESPYRTFCLVAIVMLATSVTISKLFAVKMCIT